jgi:UDP-glucose 4-epimerase
VLGCVDLLYHVAGISSATVCESRPAVAFDVNVQGTENVGWVCRRQGIPLIFLSSVRSVGDPGGKPVNAARSCKPDTVYSLTKCMGEDAVERLADAAFPAVTVRLSNVYGYSTGGGSPNSTNDLLGRSVVETFVSQALNGDPLTIFGSGSQARDFVWITDVIDALIALRSTLEYDAEVGADTFTVASGETWTITEVAELVQAEAEHRLGSAPELRFLDCGERPTVPSKIDVDIAKTSAKLGFDPVYTLPWGIGRLFDFYGV